MVTRLTSEQESKMVEYRDRYIEFGLHPKQFSEQQAFTIIDSVYKHILKKPTPPIVICPSPYWAWYGVCIYNKLVGINKQKLSGSAVYSAVYSAVDSAVNSAVYSAVYYAVNSAVYSAVNSAVRSAVNSAVYSAVRSAVYSAVYSAVRSAVYSAVNSAVYSAVDSAVNSAVRSAVDSAVRSAVNSAVRSAVEKGKMDISFVYPWLNGHYMVNYFSWFDFMFQVLNVKNPVPEAYAALRETMHMDLIYTFDDICIVSQNPIAIHKKGNTLHCENGPAVQYLHEEYYFLNGVKVPESLLKTPFNEIDCTALLKEKNAYTRREYVRKIGIERVCNQLNAKCIDKQGDYELLMLDLQDGRNRPYLKMLNPSIGIYHVEGVAPECDTVEKALNFRNGTLEKPLILT